MTSEPKFTPGPWTVVVNHPTNAVVRIHAKWEDWLSDELAALYGPQEGEKDENGVWPLGETRMANARLIAAAPDLYAALEYYADQLCEGFCKDYPSKEIYYPNMDDQCSGCKARAALAKARGA